MGQHPRSCQDHVGVLFARTCDGPSIEEPSSLVVRVCPTLLCSVIVKEQPEGSGGHNSHPKPPQSFNSVIEDNKVLTQNNVQLMQQVALLRRSLSQQQKSISEGQDTVETMAQTRALMAALANDVEEMRCVLLMSCVSPCTVDDLFHLVIKLSLYRTLAPLDLCLTITQPRNCRKALNAKADKQYVDACLVTKANKSEGFQALSTVGGCVVVVVVVVAAASAACAALVCRRRRCRRRCSVIWLRGRDPKERKTNKTSTIAAQSTGQRSKASRCKSQHCGAKLRAPGQISSKARAYWKKSWTTSWKRLSTGPIWSSAFFPWKRISSRPSRSSTKRRASTRSTRRSRPRQTKSPSAGRCIAR